MLKTSRSIESKTRPGEDGVGVSGSRAGHEGSKLDGSQLDKSELDGGEVDVDEVEVDEVGKKVQKISKSKNLSKFKKTIGSLDFLIFKAKLTFTKLKQAFLKVPILHHFDPECHIQIEIDVSGYAIDGVLSQLTLDNLGQWHLVAVFFYKMISAETKYETHDDELLAIVEVFKT